MPVSSQGASEVIVCVGRLTGAERSSATACVTAPIASIRRRSSSINRARLFGKPVLAVRSSSTGSLPEGSISEDERMRIVLARPWQRL